MSRILLVEAFPQVRQSVLAGLRAAGYDVLAAENAWQGLGALEGAPADLVVLDLEIPGLTGEGFLQDLRRQLRWQAVRVILVGPREPDFRFVNRFRVSAFVRKEPGFEQQILQCVDRLSGTQRHVA